MKQKPRGAGAAAEDKLTRAASEMGMPRPRPQGLSAEPDLFNRSRHVALRFGRAPGAAPVSDSPAEEREHLGLVGGFLLAVGRRLPRARRGPLGSHQDPASLSTNAN